MSIVENSTTDTRQPRDFGQTRPEQVHPVERAGHIGLDNASIPFTSFPDGVGGEYVKTIFTAIKKGIADAGNIDFIPHVIKIEKDQGVRLLAFSVILICMEQKSGKLVAVYPLVLAKTGAHRGQRISDMNLDRIGLTPSFGTSNKDRQNESIILPADAFDDEMKAAVIEEVNRHYNGGKEIFYIDGAVIPEYFDVQDESKLFNILKACGNASAWELYNHVNRDKDLNLAMSGSKNSSIITITVDNTSGTTYDSFGTPMFYTGLVHMSRRENQFNANSNSIHGNQSGGLLGVANITVDFLPKIVQTQYGNGSITKNVPVITIGNIKPASNYTPSYLFLMIAAAATVRTSNIWMSCLPAGEFNDVGSLNYITQLNGTAEKLDMTTLSSISEVAQVMNSLTVNEPIFTIDIPVYSPNTWFLSPLALSGAGPTIDDRAKGTQYCVDSINTLTNGHFSKNYNDNQIFTDHPLILFTGYFPDNHGELRSLSEVTSFAAVLNLLGKDKLALSKQYFDALVNSTPTNIQAQVQVLKIIREMIPQAVITGRSLRLTFLGRFLAALENAIHATDFRTNLNAPTITTGFSGSMDAVNAFMENAYVGNNNSPFIRGGGGGYNAHWNMPGKGFFQ